MYSRRKPIDRVLNRRVVKGAIKTQNFKAMASLRTANKDYLTQ